MEQRIYDTLESIKNQINGEYGVHDGIPAINHGPCGVFADVFYHAWNALFDQQVHLVLVMTPSREECDHICIRLPSGELYDGGIGVHNDQHYVPEFMVDDMVLYNKPLLEKWSYGLDRTYPRYCPTFSRSVVEDIVHRSLTNLARGPSAANSPETSSRSDGPQS